MEINNEYINYINSVKELLQDSAKPILDSCTKIDELETKINELETKIDELEANIDELKIDKLEIDDLERDKIEIAVLKKLGKIAGLPWDTIYKVIKIKEFASPEEIENARAGKVSVDQAYNAIKQKV